LQDEREGYFWDVMQGRKAPPPAAELLGFKLLDVRPEVGRIRVQFTARPEFSNPVGDIQGGFLAAMLDDTLGPALVATLDKEQFAPTLELKVNFIRPARPGILIGDGRVVSRGRTIAFPAGELTTGAWRSANDRRPTDSRAHTLAPFGVSSGSLPGR
jgi:uncharacterized protein (TIGR00369 family)